MMTSRQDRMQQPQKPSHPTTSMGSACDSSAGEPPPVTAQQRSTHPVLLQKLLLHNHLDGHNHLRSRRRQRARAASTHVRVPVQAG